MFYKKIDLIVIMSIKDLYRLNRKDVLRAANVHARAFHNDPLVCLMYPNDEERKKLSPYLWKFLILDGLRYGEVYAPTSKLEGVAKWLPPKREHIGIWRAIRSGALTMVIKTAKQKDERRISIRKIEEITDYITDIHKKLVSEPHWYLASIGVDSDNQGKGFGSKLMKPMLERIEREGYLVYLETNHEGNIDLYKHLGFEVTDECLVPETNMKNWAMIKYPKS